MSALISVNLLSSDHRQW